jgi:DHA1 family multidrug resistance protein-like MFS transporter
MLRINLNTIKAPAFASLALAFASFGDAFLYPFLPVNNGVVGVPVVWVGVLLSINRFVRIIANGWMVHLFAKYGLRAIMIVAVSIAILSTAGYGFADSIFIWLFLRILWGLAFSAMRMGTVGYAIQQKRQGFSLGLSKSLQEAGPTLALLITPLLLNSFTGSTVFFVLFALSLPALFFAWNLPITDDKTQPRAERKLLRIPSTYNSITLISAVLIDGIMVVVLGVLFLRYRIDITPLTATALAAFYLGYRRICLVILTPFGGAIADRVGMDVVFGVTMSFVIIGLLILVTGWIEVGSVIVFAFYSVNAAVTPGAVTKGESHSLSAVAENATWRDLGAAVGTLVGGFLIASGYLDATLLIATFMLVILLLVHLGKTQRVLKTLMVWK